MAENKLAFDYGDKVVGHVDGFPMETGVVFCIDPDSEFPYMLKTDEGRYPVFSEDELTLVDETAEVLVEELTSKTMDAPGEPWKPLGTLFITSGKPLNLNNRDLGMIKRVGGIKFDPPGKHES